MRGSWGRLSCVRIPILTALAVLLLPTLTACDDVADELPGAYVGRLDTAVSASRMTNVRPNGDSYQGDISHYSGGTSTEGLRFEVRRTADVGGSPSYDASLGELCGIRFQLLEGGHISDNMLPVTCRCQLDGHWVEGEAAVTGDFSEHELRIQVDVTLPRSEYAGGCTHSFQVSRP